MLDYITKKLLAALTGTEFVTGKHTIQLLANLLFPLRNAGADRT